MHSVATCTFLLFFEMQPCSADFVAAWAELTLPHECKSNKKTQPKVVVKQVKQRDYPNNVKNHFSIIFLLSSELIGLKLPDKSVIRSSGETDL